MYVCIYVYHTLYHYQPGKSKGFAAVAFNIWEQLCLPYAV